MIGLKATKSKGYLHGALFSIVLLLILNANCAGYAKNNPPSIRMVQEIKPVKTGLLSPAGLEFSFRANNFYMVEVPGYNPVVSDVTVLKNVSAVG